MKLLISNVDIWFPTSLTSDLSLICLPACRNLFNGNSCLTLISSQLEASEWDANLRSSFFWREVQFPSDLFQYLLGQDNLLSMDNNHIFFSVFSEIFHPGQLRSKCKHKQAHPADSNGSASPSITQ